MAIHNLLIPKGDDFELRLTLRHGTALRCEAAVSAVPTVIKINPIGANMAIGEKLRYGNCGELTLTAAIGPLDMVATVANVPDKLPAGQPLQGNPIDVTGWQGFSSVRSAHGAALSWNAVCTIDGPAINGTFLILFPRSISSTIPANCSAPDLFDLGGFDLDNAPTWGKFAKTAYVWDFDTIDLSDRRTRRIEGRALVSGEVTV